MRESASKKNRENKITGIFHEETFEVSSLIISFPIFSPSVKEEEKELITAQKEKYGQTSAFLLVCQHNLSFTGSRRDFPEGWARFIQGKEEVIPVAPRTLFSTWCFPPVGYNLGENWAKNGNGAPKAFCFWFLGFFFLFLFFNAQGNS